MSLTVTEKHYDLPVYGFYTQPGTGLKGEGPGRVGSEKRVVRAGTRCLMLDLSDTEYKLGPK